MSLSLSHGREFVRQTFPMLASADTVGLLQHLQANWPNRRLRQVLLCGDDDAAKVALVCLSLTGCAEDLPRIAGKLSDDDPSVAEYAEHAMWSIWFRAAGPDAESRLNHAVRLTSSNEIDAAVLVLNELARDFPDFAEAHNQLAIAHFLKGEYTAAVQYCASVLELNPLHFGAAAGLGHCYAATGQLQGALEAYRRALRIHPRLDGIRQTMLAVRRALRHNSPWIPAQKPEPAVEPTPFIRHDQITGRDTDS